MVLHFCCLAAPLPVLALVLEADSVVGEEDHALLEYDLELGLDLEGSTQWTSRRS